MWLLVRYSLLDWHCPQGSAQPRTPRWGVFPRGRLCPVVSPKLYHPVATRKRWVQFCPRVAGTAGPSPRPSGTHGTFSDSAVGFADGDSDCCLFCVHCGQVNWKSPGHFPSPVGRHPRSLRSFPVPSIDYSGGGSPPQNTYLAAQVPAERASSVGVLLTFHLCALGLRQSRLFCGNFVRVGISVLRVPAGPQMEKEGVTSGRGSRAHKSS